MKMKQTAIQTIGLSTERETNVLMFCHHVFLICLRGMALFYKCAFTD